MLTNDRTRPLAAYRGWTIDRDEDGALMATRPGADPISGGHLMDIVDMIDELESE